MSFHTGQTEEANMKGKSVKKLVLSRETVANLQEKDLKKVAGGWRTEIVSWCSPCMSDENTCTCA
jgi:hypothetical protein